MDRIAETAGRILPLDISAGDAARLRQATLTKPPGSLGRLEELSIWLASVRRERRPRVQAPALILAAADHGIAGRGISAYPSEVTAQMVANFLAGGAAANVLARQMGARVIVVDAGVAADLPDHPELRRCAIGRGTADVLDGPAMTAAQARASVEAGIDIAEEAVAGGADALLLGEMGIGNSTSAAMLTAAFTGLPAAAVTGRGTGVSDARYREKVRVVETALDLHRPDGRDPLGVLAAVGGFEIGVLAGAVLGGAAARLPLILDGYITGAAALIATALVPEAAGYLLASHRSVEIGHGAALDRLGLVPLLDLGLRLGEGSGALLALPLLQAAARLLDEMRTFAEAGVSDAAVPPAAGE